MSFGRSLAATIVAVSAIGFSAHAGGTCSDKDFRASLGEPRDQGDTGWCFAHTTADLITQKTGRRVSAFSIATDFILADLGKVRASQNPEIRAFLRRHPRILSVIRDSRREDVENYKADNILTDKGLYNTGGLEDGALLLASAGGYCEDGKLPSGEENYEKNLEEINRFYHRRKVSCPEVVPGAIGEISGGVSQVAAKNFRDWVDEKCGERFFTTPPILPKMAYIAKDMPQFEEKFKGRPKERRKEQEKLWKEIDENLDAGRVSAIGYNAYDISTLPAGENPRDGDHSSIIAARRMRDGVCEYFVRNAYGKDCDYVEPYQSTCEKEQGGTWVPRSALKTLYSVVSAP